MTTPHTDSTDELARAADEAKKAALALAKASIRCACSTTSENIDEVTRREADVLAAIDRLAAYRTRPAPETAGEAVDGVVLFDDGPSLVRRGHEDAFCSGGKARRLYAAPAPAPAARMSGFHLPRGWKAESITPCEFLTDEYNAENQWGVSRTEAPFEGPDRIRYWSGPTLQAAFERAFLSMSKLAAAAYAPTPEAT